MVRSINIAFVKLNFIKCYLFGHQITNIQCVVISVPWQRPLNMCEWKPQHIREMKLSASNTICPQQRRLSHLMMILHKIYANVLKIHDGMDNVPSNGIYHRSVFRLLPLAGQFITARLGIDTSSKTCVVSLFSLWPLSGLIKSIQLRNNCITFIAWIHQSGVLSVSAADLCMATLSPAARWSIFSTPSEPCSNK